MKLVITSSTNPSPATVTKNIAERLIKKLLNRYIPKVPPSYKLNVTASRTDDGLWISVSILSSFLRSKLVGSINLEADGRLVIVDEFFGVSMGTFDMAGMDLSKQLNNVCIATETLLDMLAPSDSEFREAFKAKGIYIN